MDVKSVLCGYLRSQRDAVLWKLDGVSERDMRMPMTASGTNMLGLVKHLAGIEAEYFGGCLGRPWPDPTPWGNGAEEANADMWATADQSPEQIVDLYRRAQAWADATIDALPVDAPAHVPWWRPPDTTLYRLLTHMIAETARHAGHLDILRETIDGQRGFIETSPNLPEVDEAWWREYVAKLRHIAENTTR
jgi:hypothetical protein